MNKILPYDDYIDELLQLEKKKTNPFLENTTYCPLGLKRPFSEYDSAEDITDADIVWFPLPEDNFTSILIIALSGTHKSIIGKRILYYQWRKGNKVVIFDLKSLDWLKAAYKPSSNYMLLKDELLDYMPIKAFAPSYIVNRMPENLKPHLKNIVTASPISQWSREDFYALDFSPTGVEVLKAGFKSGATDHVKILKRLVNDKKFCPNSATRGALIRRLAVLCDTDFISKKYPTMNIEKVWNENKIPAFFFITQMQQAMSFYVRLAISSMWQFAQKNAIPTTIYITDAPLVAGISEQGKPRPAVEEIRKVLTMYRNLKISCICETQSPSLIDPSLVEHFQYFIIGKIGNINALERAGFSSEIIRAASSLQRDQKNHIFEYLLVHEDRSTYERFFTLNSPIMHHDKPLKGVYY